MKSRSECLDFAKGYGIYLVVLGHCFAKQTILWELIYGYHMPLFFLISGFCLAESRKSCIPQIKRCIRGLFIPYIFWGGAWILYLSAMNYNEFGRIAITMSTKLVTLQGVYVLWFLIALMFAQLIIIIIKQINPGFVKYLVPLSFVFTLLALRAGLDVTIIRGGAALFYTSCGYYGAERQLQNKIKNPIHWWLVIGGGTIIYVVLCLSNGMISLVHGKLNNPALYFLTGIIGSLVHIAVCYNIVKINLKNDIIIKWILLLGRYSIIVLVTHNFIIDFIRLVDYKFLIVR